MKNRRPVRKGRDWCLRIFALASLAVACEGSEVGGEDAGDAGVSGFVCDDPLIETSHGDWFDPRENRELGDADWRESVHRPAGAPDIVELDGGRLYAMSRAGGLSIIDASVQDELRVLGRYRTSAAPFSMFVRDSLALILLSKHAYPGPGQTPGSLDMGETSRIVAIDTSDPGRILELVELDVPGEILDSRLVGDILYVIAFAGADTVISSFDAANFSSLQPVDRMAFPTGVSSGETPASRVAIAPNRLYVYDVTWAPGANSTITVVDISDPTGHMTRGAELVVDGDIGSRWHIDEYEGTLRVASPMTSSVTTFRIVSSAELEPLGFLTLQMPESADVFGVRFDGPRAFAYGASVSDPLVAIDLSDPAVPRQLGWVGLPGQVSLMVSRGEQLLALAQDKWSAMELTVSLIDITDLGNPTELDRVSFGEAWSLLADPSRTYRSLHVLEPEGLILVAYEAPAYDDCSAYASGIQLIDIADGTLTKRGVAPQDGVARRVLQNNGRLLTVSDGKASSLDLSDRGDPSRTAEIALSHRPLVQALVGDDIVRLEVNGWTGMPRLAVVPRADPERDEPLGTLEMNSFAERPYCGGKFWELLSAEILPLEPYALFFWGKGPDAQTRGERGTNVDVIDLTDPATPRLVSHRQFDFRHHWRGQSIYYNGNQPYAQVLEAGTGMAQIDSTVVLLRRDSDEEQSRLHVLDFSDPADPTLASTVDLPQGLGQTPMMTADHVVLTSHWESVSTLPGKVKFFLDRVDVSTPTSPDVLPSINIPGSLIGYDAPSKQLATVGYRRESLPLDRAECETQRGNWQHEDSACVVLHRSVHLAELEESAAVPLDSLSLGSNRYAQVVSSQQRTFFLRAPDLAQDEDYHSTILALSGLGSGALEMSPPASLPDAFFLSSCVVAGGEWVAAMASVPTSVAVFHAGDPSVAPVQRVVEVLRDRPSHVTVVGDRLIFSLVDGGTQSVVVED